MENIQLFAQLQGVTGATGFIELDLYKEEPIKITKSIQTVESPQSVTSSFSRTFRIPHTSTNGQFMKAVFNVNSVDFDATKKALCFLNVDGSYFASGNIRLDSIIRNDRDKKIEYVIVFMGETSTFASEVGPKFMSELDLSALAHIRDYDEIVRSWGALKGGTGSSGNLQGILKGGDVLYPLCEWGYTYGATSGIPDQSTLSQEGTFSVKGFTRPINPLVAEQFKPFIKAKYIWDRIFSEAGFTYESEFFKSDPISRLYTIMTDEDTSGATLSSTMNFSVGATPRQIVALSGDLVNIESEYQDTANSFDLTTEKFTCPVDGDFNFSVDNFFVDYVLLTNGVIPQTGRKNFEFKLRVRSSGGAIQQELTQIGWLEYQNQNTRTVVYANPALTSTLINFPQINLTKGQTVELYCRPGSAQYTNFRILKGVFNGERSGWIDPTGLMSRQYKQLDFIKGINDRFKLMWEPDTNNPKNFKIEPWIDWIKLGQKRDWTQKLNEDFDIQIEPLFYSYPRQFNFTDSSESDLYNFSYEQENKKTFGQLEKDSNIEIITGIQEIKSIFAPFPIAPIGNAENFLIPHFAKDTETQRQPIQVKPRLCFYNGMQPLPTGTTYPEWYFDNGATAIGWTTYPLVSSFDRYPLDDSAFDLSWDNVEQFWVESENGFNGRTNNTAFNGYWKTWFDYTFDPYSRIMTATFALDSKDLIDLQFNDKIFVKDAWWLVLKVTDFVLGKKQNVQVQLIKLGQTGLSILDDTSRLYKHTGVKFGATECEACCGGELNEVTIWTETPGFTNTFYYSEPSGVVPAQAGWYMLNGESVQIDINGAVIATGVCAGCNCIQSGLTSQGVLCFGETLCEAVCCVGGTALAWSNVADLGASQNLYTTSGGNLFTAFTPGWYSNGTDVVQVGSDGTTIVAAGDTSICNCLGGLPQEGPFDTVEYIFPVSDAYACCFTTGGTGASGYRPFWTVSGTDYYGTNTTEFPLGATLAGYTGGVVIWQFDSFNYLNNAVKVENGVATNITDCQTLFASGNRCPGRDNPVEIEYFWNSENPQINLDLNAQISSDGNLFGPTYLYFGGVFGAPGATGGTGYTAWYSDYSMVRTNIATTPGYINTVYTILNGVTGPGIVYDPGVDLYPEISGDYIIQPGDTLKYRIVLYDSNYSPYP